ncbi:DUF5320 domain-containing protein [Clostridium sp. D2Q-14]|uniref:DUF5320 domain-containing protein n=1 Tax=Anaeromonas gelatinilytica TaxID=2683194 RepID=UPI00193C0FFE|nr:DUF5320 domain-containing protein [Anaeromonas gelatinilytica]MBS4534031.1 DUF5320 domain-containing protein [Anaeromonas gelatinilytica]
MPGRNGTGPSGEGPMTGRGFGVCGAGSFSRRPRLGLGRRFGRYNSIEDEKAILETRLKEINQVLKNSQNEGE